VGIQTNLGATVALFAVGVVSFLGTLTVANRAAGTPAFDSSQVRLAITAAFTIEFFSILALSVSSSGEAPPVLQSLISNLTSLFAVIVGFYFAATAAVEYGRVRQGREQSASHPADVTVVEAPAATASSSLEEEVRALRAAVATLEEQVSQGGTVPTR